MLAAPDIHQHRPSWHHGKGARAEDALCFPRQRQKADGDVGLLKKWLKLVGAVVDRNATFVPWMSNPGRDLETERLQHERRRLRHHAEAEESDTPLLGSHNRRAAPLPIGLSRLIPGHVTMKTKDMHDDVFRHHRIAAWRLDLAQRRLRQLWMINEGLDPGRATEHGFQIRKTGKRIEIGMHEGEIFDVRQLSRIRPNADFQIGKLCLERVAPCLGVADMLVEINDEQRHNRLLGHSMMVLPAIPPFFYTRAFRGTHAMFATPAASSKRGKRKCTQIRRDERKYWLNRHWPARPSRGPCQRAIQASCCDRAAVPWRLLVGKLWLASRRQRHRLEYPLRSIATRHCHDPQAHTRCSDRRTDTRFSNRRTRPTGRASIPICAPFC